MINNIFGDRKSVENDWFRKGMQDAFRRYLEPNELRTSAFWKGQTLIKERP